MPITRAFMAHVTGMTIGRQTGQGLELLINSRRDGLLSLRLIAIKGKPIRVTDMRAADRPRKDGKHHGNGKHGRSAGRA
jgi:hypothetical protein